MTRWMLVLPIMLGLIAAACGGAGAPSDAGDGGNVAVVDIDRPAPDPEAMLSTARAVTALSLDLYREIAVEGQNLVFSPYSAAVALGMARVGARGQTAVEMDAVLYADLAGDLNAGFNALEQALASRPGEFETVDGPLALELATANRIWSQDGLPLEQPFLETLAGNYGAGVRLVDYAEDTEGARQQINDWVSDRTNDRIPMLIPVGILNPSTRLVLTNAVYLNAPWAVPFSPAGDDIFRRLDGTEVQTPFMRLDIDFAYGEGPDYQAIELPYIGGELSMVVLVPEAGAFAEVEALLTATSLANLPAQLEPRAMFFRFPKFEFRVTASLSDALKNLGMPTAFGAGADFSGITGSAALSISEVLHEAFIAVDELGTEAAAATAVAFDESAPADPVHLTVDRPFIFFIRDVETNTILFLGRVLDPTAS
jgi:serine protease inhibitor